MTETYTTDKQCYNHAGNKGTPSGNTFPDTTTIDDTRSSVYSSIGGIIGHGVTDSNNVAFSIELEVVQKALIAIKKGEDHTTELTPDQKKRLTDEFGDKGSTGQDMGFEMWTPGENT